MRANILLKYRKTVLLRSDRKAFMRLATTLLYLGLFVVMAFFAPAGHMAIAAPPAQVTQPTLSIPTGITASPNSTVSIPVQFAAGGHLISSMAFSVDYNNTWLWYDPSVPNAITLNIPAGFVGDCQVDTADLDGEIDCVIYDPLTPLAALPDSVVVTIVLRTLNPAETITVPVSFSTNSPPYSFGNTEGQSVPGTAVNGSVTIQSGGPGLVTKNYLPMVWHWPGGGGVPPPPPDCYNPIQNGDFEATSWWQFPATEHPANYSTTRSHSPIRSARTGIVSTPNVYSYSSVRSLAIYIPADAYRVKLHLWEYPASGEVGYGALMPLNLLPAMPEVGVPFELAPLANDVQYAIILDVNDNVLEFVMWKLSNEQYWVWHQFGLLRYAGRSIKVQFGTYNDGWGGISSMYVDDVDLEICR